MARQIHKNNQTIVSRWISKVYRLLTIVYEPKTTVNDSLTIVFICKTIFNSCKPYFRNEMQVNLSANNVKKDFAD